MGTVKTMQAWLLNLCCRSDSDTDLRLEFVLDSAAAAEPQPDLICLQEVTGHTHKRLQQFAEANQMQLCPATWQPGIKVSVATLWRAGTRHVSPAECIEHNQKAAGVAVSNTGHAGQTEGSMRMIRLSAPEGLEYSACICLVGGGVNVCNLHLPAGHEHGREALDLMLGELAGVSGPVLLLGDFNFDLDRDTQMKEMLHAQGLVDSWRTCRPQDPGYTQDTFRNPLRRQLQGQNQFQQRRADGVFSRGALATMSTELLFCQRDHKYQVYASDHFGVACQIDLTGKANSKPELPDPLAHAAQQMICSLGEDPCRQGLRKTPARVAKAWRAFTEGYHEDLHTIVNGALFDEGREGEVVLVRDITFYSMCEHHMVPFYGKCHVAYMSKSKVVGLSKIVRIVEMFSRRLQVQERLTRQIAAAVQEILEPMGVAVMMSGVHMCMCSRGVRNSSASTTTNCMHGVYKTDPNLRNEFMGLAMGPKL